MSANCALSRFASFSLFSSSFLTTILSGLPFRISRHIKSILGAKFGRKIALRFCKKYKTSSIGNYCVRADNADMPVVVGKGVDVKGLEDWGRFQDGPETTPVTVTPPVCISRLLKNVNWVSDHCFPVNRLFVSLPRLQTIACDH